MFLSFIITDLQIDCIFLWYSSAGYIVNTYLRIRKYSISITSKFCQCPILLGSHTVRCLKTICNQGFSGPYFPAFRLNTERYFVFLRIQSKCRKKRTIKNFETDTFYQVRRVTASYSKPQSV